MTLPLRKMYLPCLLLQPLSEALAGHALSGPALTGLLLLQPPPPWACTCCSRLAGPPAIGLPLSGLSLSGTPTHWASHSLGLQSLGLDSHSLRLHPLGFESRPPTTSLPLTRPLLLAFHHLHFPLTGPPTLLASIL